MVPIPRGRNGSCGIIGLRSSYAMSVRTSVVRAVYLVGAAAELYTGGDAEYHRRPPVVVDQTEAVGVRPAHAVSRDRCDRAASNRPAAASERAGTSLTPTGTTHSCR